MSSLTFDSKTGINIPEPADVREATAQEIKQIFAKPDEPELNTDAGTPGGQVVDLIAGEQIGINAKLAFVAQQLNPAIASGRWQEALGKLYFLERKRAEPSVATCQCRGLSGTVIPYGAQVKTDDGLFLMATGQIVIGDNGEASGSFRTMTTGPIDIAPHTITNIVTLIPGWDSVDNEASGAQGRYEETRAEFEARRVASVAINSKYYLESIEAAVSDVAGVIDCRVLENYTNVPKTESGITIGGHSIAVCVYGGIDEDIAKAIAMTKPPGTGTTGETVITHTVEAQNRVYQFNIVRPTPTDVKLEITLDKEVSADINASIVKAVVEEFLGNGISGRDRVGLGETVFAYRFAPAIINIIGSRAYLAEVKISLGDSGLSNAITINANVEPVFNEGNITIKSLE